MSKPKPLADVFRKQKKLIKNEDKIENLRVNATPGLYYILHLAHKEEAKWLLEPGLPEFERDVAAGAAMGITPSNLFRELRVFYLFLEGGHPNLDQKKREKLFIDLLERLHDEEIAIIAALKDGKFAGTYRCSRAVVDEAFPGLLDMPFSPKFLR